LCDEQRGYLVDFAAYRAPLITLSFTSPAFHFAFAPHCTRTSPHFNEPCDDERYNIACKRFAERAKLSPTFSVVHATTVKRKVRDAIENRLGRNIEINHMERIASFPTSMLEWSVVIIPLMVRHHHDQEPLMACAMTMVQRWHLDAVASFGGHERLRRISRPAAPQLSEEHPLHFCFSHDGKATSQPCLPHDWIRALHRCHPLWDQRQTSPLPQTRICGEV